MRKSAKNLLLSIVVLISAACQKDVDKTSGVDLFFGKDAKYKRTDLKMYPYRYKNLNDTLPLRMLSSANHSAFIFTIKPSRDTILIKIANTSMDTLMYTVKRPSNACEPYSIEQAYLNHNEVVPINNIFVLKKRTEI